MISGFPKLNGGLQFRVRDQSPGAPARGLRTVAHIPLRTEGHYDSGLISLADLVGHSHVIASTEVLFVHTVITGSPFASNTSDPAPSPGAGVSAEPCQTTIVTTGPDLSTLRNYTSVSRGFPNSLHAERLP